MNIRLAPPRHVYPHKETVIKLREATKAEDEEISKSRSSERIERKPFTPQEQADAYITALKHSAMRFEELNQELVNAQLRIQDLIEEKQSIDYLVEKNRILSETIERLNESSPRAQSTKTKKNARSKKRGKKGLRPKTHQAHIRRR
jgi:hypothetical protein